MLTLFITAVLATLVLVFLPLLEELLLQEGLASPEIEHQRSQNGRYEQSKHLAYSLL